MRLQTRAVLVCALTAAATWLSLVASPALARTEKPPLHGQHWMAITGKPLAATAGAMMFQKGGNAIDATCAMLAAVSTMWDVLSWGGETQALIYNPNTGKVIGVNALGVAPTGATPEFYRKHKDYPHLRQVVLDLKEARSELEDAKGDFRGNKDKALDHIADAIKQVNLAIDHAKDND